MDDTAVLESILRKSDSMHGIVTDLGSTNWLFQSVGIHGGRREKSLEMNKFRNRPGAANRLCTFLELLQSYQKEHRYQTLWLASRRMSLSN
jgi:hypothetical protein